MIKNVRSRPATSRLHLALTCFASVSGLCKKTKSDGLRQPGPYTHTFNIRKLIVSVACGNDLGPSQVLGTLPLTHCHDYADSCT